MLKFIMMVCALTWLIFFGIWAKERKKVHDEDCVVHCRDFCEMVIR